MLSVLIYLYKYRQEAEETHSFESLLLRIEFILRWKNQPALTTLPPSEISVPIKY